MRGARVCSAGAGCLGCCVLLTLPTLAKAVAAHDVEVLLDRAERA